VPESSTQLPRETARPLEGVTVIDLSWHLAGPYCTMILADLGARVIKVEAPGSLGGYDPGGIIRHRYHGQDLHYISVNRGKESLTLDLKDPVGRADFLKLVSSADVVFDNFRPGVMQRLGLDFDTLAEHNPRVISVSISSFGATGPESLRPGVDLVLQAMSGGMSMTGFPGQPPVRAGIPVADLAGSMWTATAVLAALLRRANGWTRPQRIDTSLLDGQIALMPYFAAYYLNSGFIAGPQGSGGHSPTYGAFAASDGKYFVIAVIDQEPWRRLCAAIGAPWLPDDLRFASPASRIDHGAELTQVLQDHFRSETREAWLGRLYAHQVPAGPVNDIEEALAEAQVLAREMVVRIPHLSGGEVGLTGSPIKLSDFRPEYGAAPDHGSDTQRLRAEFGLKWRNVDERPEAATG
jgi:crotonobetainyl-CoA:carnitine CoA-transferase CaiB-like acyl-CoA transferase